MKLLRSVLLFAVPIVLLGCTDTATAPGADGYPQKLYTHEVLYDAVVFKQRRDDLVQRIPAGSIVFLTTNDLYTRNGDIDYDFRASSAFFYLTGFEEPTAVAVIRRKPSPGLGSELIMFVQERSPSEVQWMGPVAGPAGAVQRFGADSAYAIGHWPTLFRSYLATEGVQGVAANLSDNASVAELFGAVAVPAPPVYDVKPFVDPLRLMKSAPEIESIRRAAKISVQAFGEAMGEIRPGMVEYEVQAIMELVLRLNGCPRTSFPTIVASGPNITTIHYSLNARSMQAGDLVMIDYGAEYGYYAADVTRTIPVSGTFSASQAVVYDIVKSGYDAVLAAAKPGVSYTELSVLNRETLIRGLVSAGIISGSVTDIIASGQYRLYIPAGLGHSVGLDVHDPWPAVNNTRILAAGMVLAIEPHLYLSGTDATVAAPYRGVCARIEDDILITSTGYEILGTGLPTARAEVEMLMKK